MHEPNEDTKLFEVQEVLGSDGTERTPNPYLTIIAGSMVGRTYPLRPGKLLVGRASDSDIALDDEGVSRRHALLVSTADGRVAVEDLGSTNGTMVDGKAIELRQLRGGERVQFGSDTIFKFEFRDNMEEQSTTMDPLTGVYSAHFLREQLRLEFAWHLRHNQPLSVIFLEIDRFKKVNDKYGHLARDAVLCGVAVRCKTVCRPEDIFGRYSGEKFACLLRQTTSDGGSVLAERMRQFVEEEPFKYATGGSAISIPVTISAGIAQLDRKAADHHTLLEEADRLLNCAKKGGRNRIESAAPSG